jgi:hypothetical protein
MVAIREEARLIQNGDPLYLHHQIGRDRKSLLTRCADTPNLETVSQHEKTTSWERGEAVGWKRFRAVTLRSSDSEMPSI